MVDSGVAGRLIQTLPGDPAHTYAPVDGDAGFLRTGYPGDHICPVGVIGIVAAVLAYRTYGVVTGNLLFLDQDVQGDPAGGHDVDRIYTVS